MKSLLLSLAVAGLSCLLTAPATAGCVSFGSPDSPLCAGSSAELVWLNAPASRQLAPIQKRSWDPPHCCWDPAVLDKPFSHGTAVTGDLEFEFRGEGRHLVEVFLYQPGGDRNRFFILEVEGQAEDKRATYATPQFSLVGWVGKGQKFRIRSAGEKYVVAAVRWTPADTFERVHIPRLVKRGRVLLASPFLPDGTRRLPYFVEQVFTRLHRSSNRDVSREGLLGEMRLVYWRLAEAAQESDFILLSELLAKGLKQMPEDTLFRQMASGACRGQNQPRMAERIPAMFPCEQVNPVPWAVDLPPMPPGAPAWAVAQRMLSARLEKLTTWWVEKRQRENGELGGGWGDDVEILRSWGPQALGFGSQVAAHGLRKLAEGLWRNGNIVDGYAKKISDSEHSAEDIADTQPLLAATFPEDPEIIARLKQTTACSENWLIRQPDGFWRFRGSWFNCSEFSPNPDHAIDVHYNVRAMGPALWYASLTRDPAVIERVVRWAESWLRALRSTDHGKPAGVIPPVLISSNGSYLVRSQHWDKPNAFWDYFHWSGYSQEGLTNLLLAVYDLTGEKKWLDAVGETFQVLEHCGTFPRICSEIRQRPEAFYEWRRLTGSARYDAQFPNLPDTDATRALALMEGEAQKAVERIGYNFDLYTSEPMWTDRIPYGLLSAEYKSYLFGGDAPRGERYPTFAVTWPATKASFARAVLNTTGTSAELRLYSFEPQTVHIPVRLWRLQRGKYEWESSSVGREPSMRREFEFNRSAQKLELLLPPQEEVTIRIKRISD